MQISLNANAKINLFLDIQSRRDDGYHDIISLMQSVSLHDTVTVEYTPFDNKIIEITSNRADIPCDRSNLAYKAAEIFPIECGKIKIHIEKNIPVSAGLAGGSTDAAAVISALNILTESKFNTEELKKIGARLGADVPFCIHGGAALARGVGEILTEAPSMPHLPLLIAKKGDGMSTPAAYKALDAANDNFIAYNPQTAKLNLLGANKSDNVISYCDGLFNIFESVVEPIRPEVTALKNMFCNLGAIKSMMSGSGTSVFAIFENEESAVYAQSQMENQGITAHLCYPC